MRKKKEPTYSLTPKGFFSIYETENPTTGLWDALRLHCYEHGHNAILIDKEGGQFITVELRNE